MRVSLAACIDVDQPLLVSRLSAYGGPPERVGEVRRNIADHAMAKYIKVGAEQIGTDPADDDGNAGRCSISEKRKGLDKQAIRYYTNSK